MTKKKNGYWTIDRCKEEALKYTQRSKFEKGCGSAYIIAMRKGWLDEICIHMTSPQKVSGFWSAEKCLQEARKYSTVSDFKRGSPGAYDACRRHGIYDKCCQHMASRQKRKGHWTKTRCSQEALKFTCRSDFFKNSLPAYAKCHKMGWLDEVCGHMSRPKSDANVLYIWRTSHVSELGMPVYKVGVTSKRLGLSRISQCKASLSSDYADLVFYKEMKRARCAEKLAKNAGIPFTDVTGNGYTELRVMTESELEKTIILCMGFHHES